MPRHIADPLFGGRLRELRRQRGLTMKELGGRASYTEAYVSAVELGKRPATPQFAQLVDDALDAGGVLAAMVRPWNGLTGDDDERIAKMLAEPRRVDRAGLDAIDRLLADARHLEDEVGSAAVKPPVLARLHLLEDLVADARGPLRPAVLDAASQWAQFGGWLDANTSEFPGARRWFAQTLAWALETGDPNMVATALSMTGQTAWMSGNPQAAAALADAAAGHPSAAPAVRAMAIQLRTRARAEMGVDEVDRAFDEAQELLGRGAPPPWMYFYGPGHLTLQRGLAYNRIGRHSDAAAALRAGLAAVPDDIRHAEWIGPYLYELARAELAAGEREAAEDAAEELAVAAETGSRRLGVLTNRLRALLSGC